MLGEENGRSSKTSPISLDRLQSLGSGDAPERQSKRITTATKKRKRSSFASPRKGADKHNKDIFGMLKSVPQIDEHFDICDKIGEGTFSSVYRAKLKKQDGEDCRREFALKHIIPTSHPDRILSELSCLVRIGGVENVMGVELTLREKDNIVIVMPYFKHNRFQDFYHEMSIQEVREYMQNLLIALKRVHKFSVIHRDVKPGNFLYNREAREYALVDFGLAQAVPTVSKAKMSAKSSKGSTVGGVLHHDTPRPPAPKKNVCRAKSTTENKIEPVAAETMWSQPSTVPRLVELDPNTFDHSERSKSSRDRNDLEKGKKSESLIIPRDGEENIPAELAVGGHNTTKTVMEVENLKPVILTRRCTAVVRRGVKGKVGQRSSTASESQAKCSCFGLPLVCDVCTARKNQVAPRAGTPGFRSPEVLLKCPDQTTAVDMWAAGVILLSILSGRYPFFRAPDDLTALAQIMSIMGTEETKAAADQNGKHLQCSVKLPAMDLKIMCRQLRFGAVPRRESTSTKRRRSNGEVSKRARRSLGNSPTLNGNDGEIEANGSTEAQKNTGSCVRSEKKDQAAQDHFPDSAYDLLKCLLELNPKKRITAVEALKHPFITGESS